MFFGWLLKRTVNFANDFYLWKKFDKKIKIKRSLDSNSLLNPGKVYPILRKCAEEGRVHVHRGKTKFSDIPRF